MPLMIQLASGRSVLIDEETGAAIGDAPLGYDPGDDVGDDQGDPVDVTRGEIAAKAGYPSWDAYVKAVGEIKALQTQQLALQVTKLQNDVAREGGISPAASAQLAQAQQQFNVRLEQDRTELSERQRQFNETFGANKAEFNIRQNESARQFNDRLGFDREQLDVRRGETLLNLGSRPDTLIRYLHALRGQQAPQGLGTPPALPGFPGTAAYPTAQQGVPLGTPNAVPARRPPDIGSTPGGNDAVMGDRQRALPVAESGQMIGLGQSATIPAGQSVRTPSGSASIGGGGGTISVHPSNFFESLPATDPRSPNYGKTAQAAATPIVEPRPAPPITSQVQVGNLSPDLQRISSSVQFAPSGTQFASGPGMDENEIINQIRSREQYNAAMRAQGGKEIASLKYDPSVGRLYAKGGVIPEPVVGVGLISGQAYTFGEKGPETVVPEGKSLAEVKGKKPKKAGAYQTGGTIGYSSAFAPPELFNPKRISNTFGFPQIPHFTGNTSLVPSAQRLFQALPSERALYAGYLNDEAGTPADDVFEIARRLAPKVTGLNAGRFTN